MTVTLKQLHDEYSALLLQAGIDTARLDVRILLSHAYGLSHEAFLTNNLDIVDPQPAKQLIQRRLQGEPVAKILGHKEFWSLDFTVDESVLDPRPDSETLIDTVLQDYRDYAGEMNLSILDLGTGSGCLLISLLKELPMAAGYAIDISPQALAIAQRNAMQNKVIERCHFICGDWVAALNYGLQFDIIISNPPYIPTGQIAELAKDVRDYDPLLALDGGADGLESYRQIAELLPRLSKKGGHIYFECGQGQHNDVQEIIRPKIDGKFIFVKDLSKVNRVIKIQNI